MKVQAMGASDRRSKSISIKSQRHGVRKVQALSVSAA
jgi:hypothetical protein